MRIDLHTHSSASDGTDPPAAVVEAAVAAGLDVLALTDHDTTDGWGPAGEAARVHGITLVPGIEITCERRGLSLHLLAYLPDPAFPALVAELERTRAGRVGRLERVVSRLARGGIPVTYAEVLARVPPGATPGRPHVADALVASGVVRSRDEAFARWLHDASPYYVPHVAPDPVDAVRLVDAAGGVPVLAHPFSGTRSGGVTDELVADLAAAGLRGLEIDHPDHDPAARSRARALAARLGLLATGSSDYHGSGKTNRLGQETTAPDVLAEIVRRGHGPALVGPAP